MPEPDPRFYATADLGTEVYDQVAELRTTGTSVEGDVEFYRATARRTGGPILDVGCGTGRVAFALLADGWDVVGIDTSTAMLALAERRRAGLPGDAGARLELVEGDMTDFDLGRAFPLVVVAFRVFQFLLTPESQRAGLAALRRHMAPEGLLVLDLFDPRLDLCVPEFKPPAVVDVVRHPETGNDVRVQRLERVNDPVRQVLDEVWLSTEVDSAGRELRSQRETLSLRWTYRWEMRHLLELAGLEVVSESGDFLGSPPAYGREQVWVIRRPD
jgi:SAM-dependent methyltransferase